MAGKRERGYARVTMAMLAYSMPPSAAAAVDAPGTPPSSRPAGRAGTASTTASAVISSGAAADPTVSRHPVPVRASSRTVARVRMTAPEASATAAGSTPRPPASVVNTGRGGGAAPGTGGAPGSCPPGEGSSDAAAPVSERCAGATAASGPSVASNDSSSDRPA